MFRVDSIDAPPTWHATEAEAIREKLRRVEEIRARRGDRLRGVPVLGVVVWDDGSEYVA